MGSASQTAGGSRVLLPDRPLNIGIVGATGNVGTMMLRVLAERGVPIGSVRAFASERSAGQTVTTGSHAARVEVLADADPAGLDVALFSAGADRARTHASRFADAGVYVIDNSSAFRMDEAVPLVVPEVNPERALDGSRVIANPNCSTIQLVTVLKPILDAVGLEHVHVTTFQAVSGTGLAAMEELQEQATASLDMNEVAASVYPHPIAFNVLPHCDVIDEDGISGEEHKLMRESRKILAQPQLAVAATCVRVPVFNAHSEAVHIQTTGNLSPSELRELLAAAPGVAVLDDPSENEYPTPLIASGNDEVFVGRIRRDPSRENGLAMFIVADNLRKGAATNAVQILELLQQR